MSNEISLQETVGKGYAKFWRFRGRYRVVKGGRGSKKSVTAALSIIYNMMKMPLANTLVIRKTFNAHKDSTWAQLKWASNRLEVSHLWKFKKSPLEAVYKPTGQKILFRGLDDPMSITSITVDTGYLCWAWFEEAYQILNEDDFDKIDMSIRGELPEGYYKQLTLSFNPWNEKHWLKGRFFDSENPNTLAMTTTYQCNEFLGNDDRELFEWMKKTKPKRYRVEGEGNWGIAEGAIYENWREEEFDYRSIAKQKGYKAIFGLDFGYTNDPTAFIAALVNKEQKKLYIFDEHYEHAMKNNEIAEMIKRKGYAKEKIIADSAEPKSIDEIRGYGIYRMRKAEKGPDSVLAGIQYLQQYEIIVHKFKCPNVSMELSSYIWDQDKNGRFLNKPIDDFNHAMDALRYAMEQIRKPAGTSF
ncbi:PBSX family phage terminase large subunit [Chengkuizengella sp. SCS-71B]|uniref:PBSX family phage terminase large subunit n=1 Tax=Chengkuizengella sp. SCS-71B TaxID=3115290 RepID=UPI0032C227D7